MANLKGKNTNDTLAGSATNAQIYGYAGNDVISTAIDYSTNSTTHLGVAAYGGAGNDLISGYVTGATAVQIGASGNDRLNGVDGADTINGGGGNDKIYGGSGNDVVYAGDGKDYVSGDTGNDTITGGQGNMVNGTATSVGNQSLAGGAGNDYIAVGSDTVVSAVVNSKTVYESHYMYGGDGADTLNAGATTAGGAFIATTGSVGYNYMYGGAGNDTILGSVTGYDTINGGLGSNTVTGGGAGGANHAHETINYFGAVKGAANGTLGGYDGVTMNLNVSTAQTVNSGITDTVTFVDNLGGSTFNDVLTGNAFANKILGGLGHDKIDIGGTSVGSVPGSVLGAAGTANAGGDVLYGGYGNDTILMHNGVLTGATTATQEYISGGDAGVDTIDFSAVFSNTALAAAAGSGSMQAIVLPPAAPSGTYTVGSITGVYVNMSSAINNAITGGPGAVNFEGAGGSGFLTGFEKIIGTNQINTGTVGAPILSGGSDYIVASANVTVMAGSGNDTLVSSQSGSKDILIGGTGANVIDGTSGGVADYMGVGYGGNDTIYGFYGTEGDKMYISASGSTALGLTAHAIGFAGTANTTALYGVGSMVDEKFNSLGKLASYALHTATATEGGLVVNATGANAANTNAQLIYNTATGDLIYDSNGITALGQTTIAHLDTNNFSSHSGLTAGFIDASDFILVA